jgi:hypothetical protein
MEQFNPAPRMPVKPRRKRLFIVTAICVCVAIAVLVPAALWLLAPSSKPAIAQATQKQHEKLTELYFNSPQYLPKNVDPQKTATFSYHVTNQESVKTSYLAVVTLYEDGKPRVLEQDAFTLSDGDDRDILLHFSTPYAGTNLEIVGSLPQLNQEIHFRSQS